MQFFKRYKSPLLALFGFFIGASLSSGLLIYSGKELVNVFVYFAFVVVLPFFFSLFSILIYIFKKDNPKLFRDNFLFGVFFSLGALLSLVFMVTTRDIAFGWATTIDISSTAVYNFLSTISFWKAFFPLSVPSLSLVEISHFTRLGSSVTKEQVDSAVLLGQWWKFLAFSILFYGVVFRGILFLIFAFKKEKKIEFESLKESEKFEQIELKSKKIKPLASLDIKVKNLIGYDLDEESLKSIDVGAKKSLLIGGKNSFSKDCDSLKKLDGKSLIVVKAWEPPVLDFIDLLECFKSRDFFIYLLGLNDSVKDSEVFIWKRKLQEMGFSDIEVYL